jgi:hypothetical protein
VAREVKLGSKQAHHTLSSNKRSNMRHLQCCQVVKMSQLGHLSNHKEKGNKGHNIIPNLSVNSH